MGRTSLKSLRLRDLLTFGYLWLHLVTFGCIWLPFLALLSLSRPYWALRGVHYDLLQKNGLILAGTSATGAEGARCIAHSDQISSISGRWILVVVTVSLQSTFMNLTLYKAQSVLDPTAIYLGGVNQKRGNNRGENV